MAGPVAGGNSPQPTTVRRPGKKGVAWVDNPVVGTVALWPADDGDPLVYAPLHEEPVASGGVGGWEEVPRLGRRPLTVWRGPEALRVTLPILFDRFAEGDDGGSVEAHCRAVLLLAGFDPAGFPGAHEPPVLCMDGPVPHARRHNRWVVDTIEWGDSLRRQSDGARVRQFVTVTLLQHTEDDRLGRVKPAGSHPATATVASTDAHNTYEKIAKWKLGSKRFGTRLARLNGKRSADAKLKRGTRVRLPNAETLAAWKRG